MGYTVLTIFPLAFISFVSVVNAVLDGPGVCYENKTMERTVPISKLKVYYDYNTYFCISWPPWCLEQIEKYKPIQTTQTITEIYISEYCCPGYKLNKDKKKCDPICNSLCQPGYCSSPHNCNNCTEGYNGAVCDPICSEYCEENACVEPNKCSKCQAGFVGYNCTASCPKGYYSENCSLVCDCPNTHYCNSLLGCICLNGYSGPDCEPNNKPLNRNLILTVLGAASGILILVILSSVLFAFISQSNPTSQFNEYDERTPILHTQSSTPTIDTPTLQPSKV